MTNETIRTLLARRSIRTYTDQRVPHETLELVLECGLYAASGGNHQVPRFTVVENPQVLEELTCIVRDEFRKMTPVEGQYWNTAILNAQNKPGYSFRFQAPVLIIVTAPAGWPNGMADCAGALQNMQVAAAALGLGACWVNQLHWLTENDVLRKYLLAYGVEESEDIYGSMVLGYPSRPAPKAAPRKPDRIRYVK